jgi:hypothetical protein
MSTPTPTPATSSRPALSKATLSKPASLRRTRYAIQTFALLFAVTACCAFVLVLGDRFPYRIDATATREHHLSARTTELLGSLDGQYELVVAANFSLLDQQAARRTQDVVDNFARSSSHIKATIIDVASARGLADLDAVLNRLIDRFKPSIEKQRAGLEAGAVAARAADAGLISLSDDLLSAKDVVKDGDPSAEQLRRFYADSAAVCRVAAENLAKTENTSKESVGKMIGRTQVPATDDAIAILRQPLSDTLTEVSKLGENLDAIAASKDDKVVAPATRERTRASATLASRVRLEIATAVTALRREGAGAQQRRDRDRFPWGGPARCFKRRALGDLSAETARRRWRHTARPSSPHRGALRRRDLLSCTRGHADRGLRSRARRPHGPELHARRLDRRSHAAPRRGLRRVGRGA